MPHNTFYTNLADATEFRFYSRYSIYERLSPWHLAGFGMMDGWDISFLTWNMNHWNWHLLTCSHVKTIKGPLWIDSLSLINMTSKHLWPILRLAQGTEIKLTLLICTFHASLKHQFRGLRRRSSQSSMLLQMVCNQPLITTDQFWV